MAGYFWVDIVAAHRTGSAPGQTGNIVETRQFVTILGAGASEPADIDEALSLAPVVVAADGGAELALNARKVPDAVIGDFDSIPARVRDRLPDARLHRIEDQSDTDFEKCLARIAAPLMLAVGFTGGRLDHELAAYSALLRFPDKRCIVIGPRDLVFLAPPELGLDLERQSRLALFPLAPVSGRSEGLLWPIDGLDFAAGGRLGTSNTVTGPVRLRMDAPGMLVILPRAALGAAIAGLTAAHDR